MILSFIFTHDKVDHFQRSERMGRFEMRGILPRGEFERDKSGQVRGPGEFQAGLANNNYAFTAAMIRPPKCLPVNLDSIHQQPVDFWGPRTPTQEFRKSRQKLRQTLFFQVPCCCYQCCPSNRPSPLKGPLVPVSSTPRTSLITTIPEVPALTRQVSHPGA